MVLCNQEKRILKQEKLWIFSYFQQILNLRNFSKTKKIFLFQELDNKKSRFLKIGKNQELFFLKVRNPSFRVSPSSSS